MKKCVYDKMRLKGFKKCLNLFSPYIIYRMPLYKKRLVSKNKTYKKKTYKKTVRPTMRKEVSAIVKNVLHKTAEDKISIDEIFNNADILGSGCDWNGTGAPTTGLIYQSVSLNGFLNVIKSGTSESQRVGNKIQPSKLLVRGTIHTNILNPVPLSVVYNPFYVHMFIYHRKGNILNGSTLQLLESPGGGLPFDGTLQRSLYPINRNTYTIIKHRVFKMAGGLQSYSVSDGWGNGFKMSQTFNIRLPVATFWKYNEGVDDPTNQNYFVFFAVVNADGTINSATTSQPRAVVNMQSVLYYEDV